MEGAMNTKCCVFVDGENLRYSIIDLFRGEFDKAEYLPKKADWTAFFDWLVNEIGHDISRFRTYWHVVEDIDFSPNIPLPKNNQSKLRQILSRHAPYKTELDQLTGTALLDKMEQLAI